jgi:hypothetical protein
VVPRCLSIGADEVEELDEVAAVGIDLVEDAISLEPPSQVIP